MTSTQREALRLVRDHAFDGDDGDNDDSPPDFVLRCDDCETVEPAPIDAVPGQVFACDCGGNAVVEVA